MNGGTDMARGFTSKLWPKVLAGLGSVYLALIFRDAAFKHTGRDPVPETVRYFTAVACLFPHSATTAIDYRVEGWSCHDRAWSEIDARLDFPIDAENKENRFYRAVHFFRDNRIVMRALDAYLVERHNERATRGAGDGGVGVVGGVRVLSLRLPLGDMNAPFVPYTRRPVREVSTQPSDGLRKDWYWTPESMRADRCERGAR